MTNAQLLRAAAKEVRRGWCQGTLEDLDGNVCALGALIRVTESEYNFGDRDRRRNLLALLFLKRIPRHEICSYSISVPETYNAAITQWNDRIGRTGDEVAAKFEEAAALEEMLNATLETLPEKIVEPEAELVGV